MTNNPETAWSTADPTVAAIAGGKATGIASGAASISADYKGKTATAQLNVDELPPEPDKVIISPLSTNQSLTIAQGEAQQFTATAVYPSRTVDITGDVTWKTGDINVAVVDTASKGLVKGKAPGQSYIWFYYNINGKTMQPSPASLLTVTPPKMRIELTYTPTKFSYRDVISLKAICKYGDPTIPDEDVTARTKYTIDTPGMFQSQNLSIVYPYIGNTFYPKMALPDRTTVSTIYATYLTQYGTIASGSVAISMDGYTPPKNPRAPGYSQLYQYTGWDTNPPDDNNWANYLYANHTADEPVVDYYWGNINVKNPYIGHLGCNLTCYSMILSTIDSTLTPGKLNRVLKEQGLYGTNGPNTIALVNYLTALLQMLPIQRMTWLYGKAN